MVNVEEYCPVKRDENVFTTKCSGLILKLMDEPHIGLHVLIGKHKTHRPWPYRYLQWSFKMCDKLNVVFCDVIADI